MPRPNNSFTSLAGVPVHYDRSPGAGYGTRGRPHTFYCTVGFQRKLEAFFAELWDLCPHGPAEVITSAGAYVDKPGYHGRGRAFDLDGIFWPNKTFVTLHDGYNAGDRKFYFGVEALLRKRFGTVLNYDYNPAHRDHFHVDDGSRVAFQKSSKSRVLFVQGALTHVLNLPLTIDGVYGSQTDHGVADACQTLGLLGNVQDPAVWLQFLTQMATTALGSGPAPIGPVPSEDKDPLVLLHDLYRVIGEELGNTVLRKPVEGALNAFANHPDTQEWLEQYR